MDPAPVHDGRRVLRTPAKVNLGLRVLGRRDDGYHLLESVFAPIDLYDELEVRVRGARAPSVSLSIVPVADAASGGLAEVPSDQRNLAHRAATAFLSAASLDAHVEIELGKRIPAAAGMGGGSSDAGAVLRALATLLPGVIETGELARLAVSLGADVPFFLDPRPAHVAGIGEEIEVLREGSSLPLVLANPGEAVSTAEVFRAWDALSDALTPNRPGSTLRALSDLRANASDPSARAAALEELLRNDLEAPAVRLCPPIRRLQQDLADAGALATGMSGSGATVFGVFKDREAAAACAESVSPGAAGWVRLAVTEAAR